MKNIAIVLSLIVLSGCVTPYDNWSHNYKNEKVEKLADEARLRDSKPNEYAYKLGAGHGCDSGSNATGNYEKRFTKDVNQYVKDVYYKSGWDDGFAQCKGRGEMINGVINNSIR